MSPPRLDVQADPAAMADHVAGWLLDLAQAKAGPFSLCLSGGSTPKALYQRLAQAPYRDAFPWDRTHLFWGDERFVPPDDPLSNFRMVQEALLDHAPIPAANIHAVPTVGESPKQAAADYARMLQDFYGAETLDPARPLFDVNLLGLGPDGHTASLFPETEVLDERDLWVAAVIGAKAEARVTLTYPVLESSAHAAFLVAGAEKAPMLKRLLAGDTSIPAGRLRTMGELAVFSDAAARAGVMSAQSLYPLRFDPIFQYRLWGGRRLGPWMDSPLPDGPVGEAWILSDRGDHASLVSEGPLKGETITSLMKTSKTEILGAHAARFDRFPLLLKFLDVEKMLSVQVHPRDDQADLIPEGDMGKTEAWLVLEAHSKGRIYTGLKPGTTAHDLRDLTTRTADDHLASFKPRVGQGVLISAGTVHSLGDGVMVFEVQENSDTTFRLYDWDHIDEQTGKPRDLQVDKALACIDLDQGAVTPVTPQAQPQAGAERERYFDDSHFRMDRLQASSPFEVGAEGEPRVLVCVGGDGAVEHGGTRTAMRQGSVVLLPASVGACRLTPGSPVTLVEIAIPDA